MSLINVFLSSFKNNLICENNSWFPSYENGTPTIFILQMRKLRFRELQKPLQAFQLTNDGAGISVPPEVLTLSHKANTATGTNIQHRHMSKWLRSNSG